MRIASQGYKGFSNDLIQNLPNAYNLSFIVPTEGSVGKELACNAGDAGDIGLIPGLGRSPGGGHNPLQCSCLQRVRHD